MYNHPKKISARQETIIDPYRANFAYRLPFDHQYWTLCSQQVHRGVVCRGTELDQLLASNLIDISQFHGVDKSRVVYQHNKTLSGPHWYHGDFYRVMSMEKAAGRLRPGIINCDLIEMPEAGSPYISGIAGLVSDIPIPIMLVANMIIQRFPQRWSEELLLETLYRQLRFRSLLNRGWVFDNRVYTYNGSGNHHRVWMGTIILRKDQQS